MHEHPHEETGSAATPRWYAAKWPPDDDAPGGMGAPGAPGVPGSPGGFGGGSFDPNEGNFKKGATKPIMILIGVLIAIGAVVLAVFAMKTEGDKMSVDQIIAERKAIAVLPKADQLPKWREWAKRDDVIPLQEDAFANLAWAKDPEGLKTIIEHGLKHSEHKVRNRAAQAIADYGSPAADSAKPALLAALKEADSTDKPQITWALAVLKESSAFDAVLEEYRAGHLATIERLDGYPAFDPDTLASMVSLDKLATYAKDPSDAVRQLIATILSRTGDPEVDADAHHARRGQGAPGRPRGGRRPRQDRERADDHAALERALARRQRLAHQVPRGASRRRRRQRAHPGAPLGAEGPRVLPDQADLRHAQGSRRPARRRHAREVHRDQPAPALEDRGRAAARRDRRRARGAVPRVAPQPGSRQALQERPARRNGAARAERRRAHRRGAHARRSRDPEPRQDRSESAPSPRTRSTAGSPRTRSRTRTVSARSR